MVDYPLFFPSRSTLTLDTQCTTGNHYYHKYLKTKCALKCVVGDTECVVGDTKVKLECGKGFWALKVLRSRRSHTPPPPSKAPSRGSSALTGTNTALALPPA